MNLRFFAPLCMCLAFMAVAEAQINVNPDLKGDPWWVSGELITPETQSIYDALPELQLTPESAALALPVKVDNSQKKFFRDIFRQDVSSYAQAAGVGRTAVFPCLSQPNHG